MRALAVAPRSARAPAAPRLGFIDTNRASFDVTPIQCLDRVFRRFVGRHLDEAKAAGSIGSPVHDYLGVFNLAGLCKRVFEILIGHCPSQIPHVQSGPLPSPPGSADLYLTPGLRPLFAKARGTQRFESESANAFKHHRVS